MEDEVKEVSLERERKVVFKPQLIDFEAPAPSESDSESEEEDFTKKLGSILLFRNLRFKVETKFNLFLQ